MGNTLQIKRRATGGSAGSPSSLATGELAYNEVDDILYYGFGDAGGGVASSIVAIGGVGAFLKLTGNQTVAGTKTFSTSPVVPDVAYGSGWNGDNSVPTKNAVYDKIETLGGGGGGSGTSLGAVLASNAFLP